MNTAINDIRDSVLGVFKVAHLAEYSTTLVNFPNKVVVDIEKQKDPFVSVDLDFERIEQSALGEDDILAIGALQVYFYFREGTGVMEAFKYYDSISAAIANQVNDSLFFEPAQIITVQTFPGWVGKMCTFRFQLVEGVSC